MKKYELHTHTYYSCCSGQSPEKLLTQCYKKGFDGVAITDHDTTKGYHEAVKVNKKLSKRFGYELEIIPAIEIKTQFGDLIVYFMKKEIKTKDFYEACRQAKEQGALCIIPHPFRARKKAAFKKDIGEIKHLIDGLEAFNGRTGHKGNLKAQEVAKQLDLPMTAGSDAHFSYEVGTCTVYCEKDLKQDILNKRLKVSYNPTRAFINYTIGSLNTVYAKKQHKKHKHP